MRQPHLPQHPLHPLPLRRIEPVERLGREVVADAKARQRALDALDDGRTVATDMIEQVALANDVLERQLEFPVSGAGGRTVGTPTSVRTSDVMIHAAEGHSKKFDTDWWGDLYGQHPYAVPLQIQREIDRLYKEAQKPAAGRP